MELYSYHSCVFCASVLIGVLCVVLCLIGCVLCLVCVLLCCSVLMGSVLCCSSQGWFPAAYVAPIEDQVNSLAIR